MSSTVKVRAAEREDLIHIEQLAKKEDFHIGLHNWSLYFETGEKYWQVAENDNGEIVGYKADNMLSTSIKYAFQLVIREDYRGMGLTRLFDTMHYSKLPTICNATASSLSRYKFDCLGERLLGFCGTLESDVEALNSTCASDTAVEERLEISDIDPSNIDDVCWYDTAICGLNRRNFVKEWCLAEKYPCDTLGVLAKSGRAVVGYACLREYDQYWAIAPLYAENDTVACQLLYHLLKGHRCKNKALYLLTKADNKVASQFVSKLDNVEICDDETRAYSNGAKPLWTKYLDQSSYNNSFQEYMNKAYALYDFWPV